MENDKTCYAIFTGKNGYPHENERANQTLTIGKKYKVVGGTMGRCHTSLKLEDVIGQWNSVMFDIVGDLPFSFEDSYVVREKVVTDTLINFIKSQKDMDIECKKVLYENLWDLY
jgi:hypothetical protein